MFKLSNQCMCVYNRPFCKSSCRKTDTRRGMLDIFCGIFYRITV